MSHERVDTPVALEVFRRRRASVHLVLTDIVISGMSGLDLVKRLRVLRRETPVFLMTGYAGDPCVGSEVESLGAPLLPKPFTPDALAQKVREVLDGAAA